MKKKLLFFILALSTSMGMLAVDADDVRIYINPGHGGWGPNDRPLATISYPLLSSTGRPDTCGFYESNTNLWKGLKLRETLINMGVSSDNITMSRTANGPYPYDGNTYGAYSKKLSVIAGEADEGDYDMFISIHSNATNDGSTSNYPLYLYRGTDASESASGSKAMCQASWPRHWMDELDPQSLFSKTNTYIKGDVTFYGSGSTSSNSAGNSYYGYLGALKHSVPGFLVEGYFHTYQPARHRALNKDYCGQEGVRYARGICDYFSLTQEATGYIMGSVHDAVNSLENDLYTYSSGTIDAYAPINGAVVRLYKGGTLVDSYTTDGNYNGIFVFENLAPGNDYTISVSADGFTDLTNQGAYTVTANETTYMVLYMSGDDNTQTVKGIFAYALDRTATDEGGYSFTFNANTAAREAYLVFTDSTSGNEVGRIALTDVTEGENTFTLTADQLPGEAGQVMNWAVNVIGDTIKSIKRLNDTYATYTRATVAIDRSPESDHFATIYVNERVAKNNSGNGLYACDVNAKPINSTVYAGGQTWGNNYRICVDAVGKIYIPDWADATSGIYIADPDNLEGTFSQFYVGTRDTSTGLINSDDGDAVGGSTPSVWVEGSGASTKLYAYHEDISGASGNVNGVGVYNIGQVDGSLLTTWNNSPSNYLDIGEFQKNGNGNIIADPEGRGVWVAQYRSSGNNTSEIPSLVFVDNEGNVLFNSGSSLTSLSGSLMSGFAINNSNDVLVINDGDGVLQFYSITWNSNIPMLTATGTSYIADARTSAKAIYQMAFDWGGNLVCAGANVGIYSIPTDDNQSTTPAKTALTVIKPETTTSKDTIVNNSYSIEKVWELTEVPAAADNRQGFGMGGKFYINDKSTQSINVYDDNGLTMTTYDGGNNCGITRDEAGNIIVSLASFANAWDNSSALLRVINPTTGESVEYALPDDVTSMGRCDFVGFPKGDLMSDGELYLAGANSGNDIVRIVIVGGAIDTDNSYTINCNGVNGTSSTVLNHYTDLNGDDAVLYVTRSANPLKLTVDGDSFASTMFNLPNKGSCNGVFPFVWDGKELMVYPTIENYLDGFAVAQMNADTALVSVTATATDNANSFQCDWLNAEVESDTTALIYQYYPGGHITVWRITHHIEDSHGYVKGDVNHDNNVDINDVALLISRVLNNATVKDCCDICGNIDDNDTLDITDVTLLISLVLNSN